LVHSLRDSVHGFLAHCCGPIVRQNIMEGSICQSKTAYPHGSFQRGERTGVLGCSLRKHPNDLFLPTKSFLLCFQHLPIVPPAEDHAFMTWTFWGTLHIQTTVLFLHKKIVRVCTSFFLSNKLKYNPNWNLLLIFLTILFISRKGT
jgi:hypothetical protein